MIVDWGGCFLMVYSPGTRLYYGIRVFRGYESSFQHSNYVQHPCSPHWIQTLSTLSVGHHRFSDRQQTHIHDIYMYIYILSLSPSLSQTSRSGPPSLFSLFFFGVYVCTLFVPCLTFFLVLCDVTSQPHTQIGWGISEQIAEKQRNRGKRKGLFGC